MGPHRVERAGDRDGARSMTLCCGSENQATGDLIQASEALPVK